MINASRDQKLTFVAALAKVPEPIKQLKSGESGHVSATLTCFIRHDGPKHWNARVDAIRLHQRK